MQEEIKGLAIVENPIITEVTDDSPEIEDDDPLEDEDFDYDEDDEDDEDEDEDDEWNFRLSSLTDKTSS